MRLAGIALGIILAALLGIIVMAVAWDFLSSAFYQAGQ